MAFNKNIEIRNKKALFEYYILEEYTAGIVLKGSEIKAIRENKASIKESHCVIKDNEMFIINMFIGEYSNSGHTKHEEKRKRKLLLKRSEINKIHKKVKIKGNTIIATRLFINEKNIAKLDVALAKGKHTYDKRKTLKERDVKIQMERDIKS